MTIFSLINEFKSHYESKATAFEGEPRTKFDKKKTRFKDDLKFFEKFDSTLFSILSKQTLISRALQIKTWFKNVLSV